LDSALHLVNVEPVAEMDRWTSPVVTRSFRELESALTLELPRRFSGFFKHLQFGLCGPLWELVQSTSN